MIRIYAEYEAASELLAAIHQLAPERPGRLEAFTPYPVPGIDEALGAPPSRLSISVLVAGFGAAATAYGLQWLLDGYLYPLDVGGRPPHFPLAFVPITFEMGVLFASLTAVVAVLVGARLARLWHASSEVDGIESSTGNGFWLEIERTDPSKDVLAIEALVRATNPRVVRRTEVT
ncbi:MAG: DUF3341 domain-containing protein [Kofleriaceae bacterium]